MHNKILKIISDQATRHYARVMAFAILGIVVGALFTSSFVNKPLEHSPEGTNESSEVVTEVSDSLFARSAPKRLIIPKINLDTTFVSPLGLNEDQTVSVPDSYEKVGWYKNGATPGEIGSSVILGHVDSLDGPAIFFSLGQLDEGDEVQIERQDGTTATFVVTDKERVSQNKFPTQKVYGKVDYAGLRLVTCTGIYDHGSLKYSHNLIVYAELKEVEQNNP